MIFEITNPSDPYTIEGDDWLALCVATCVLGCGAYGLRPVDADNEKEMPIFLIDGHDEWFQKEFGKSFKDALTSVSDVELINAFDSVLIGSGRDRKIFNDGLALIDDPEKRQLWRKNWLNVRQSSLNDIGGRAAGYAEMLRAKQDHLAK